MSTTLREGELRVQLPRSARGRKFDDRAHGLSHCMKAVDWIIETPDKVYFVEVKDLDARGATGREARKRYFDDLEAGRKDGDFVAKFRDSFIYQWACEQVDRPIVYLVVIAYTGFDKAMLLNRTDALRRGLPVAGTPKAWQRPIAKDVLVLNQETWNELPGFAMERMP